MTLHSATRAQATPIPWPRVRAIACAGLVSLVGASAMAQGAQALPADHSTGMASLSAVWEAGSTDARLAEQLIAHFRAGAQPLRAIAVAEQAYERLQEPRWLLLAMDTAVASGQSQALRALLARAGREQSRFDGSAMYWLIQAHAASGDGDRGAARAAYDKALAIDPGSADIRAQVLWFEINGGDTDALSKWIQRWQEEAQSQPGLWMPFAVGLVKVGRPDDSVAWYERQALAAPDDVLWRLSYAYVLAEAGRPDVAQNLRRAIYQHLKNNPGLADALAPTEQRTLLLAQAGMALDVDGAAAAQQVLQNTLARGHRDAEVYSQLVGASLALGQTGAAHGWLGNAREGGFVLPAYQVLGVATARHDTALLDTLLRERSEELSTPDQVWALRRLRRHADAMALVERSLAQADEATARLLRQHRHDIQRDQARHVEARVEGRDIGELDIRRHEISGSKPTPWGRVTVSLADNALRSEKGATVLAVSHRETDLSVVADTTAGGDPLRLTLGTSLGSPASLVYASAAWSRGLGGSLRAGVEARVNALTEESAAMRALGRKDRLSFALSGNPSSTTHARVEWAMQRFQTREGASLGRGLRLEGEIGAELVAGSPSWHVRLSGSADRNRLAGGLPASLVGTSLSPFATVESLLSPRFSTLGVGSTLRLGQMDGAEREPHGFVDFWLGRQWPASELAYSLRLGVGVPVQSAGLIQLEAHHINIQNSVTGAGKSAQGISMGYRHAF
ncbi:MAG: tetratricopeptide repeat protein [Hydrogenophaga sp.]|nr:tetratricopeptide repeat protein [Hydrogenophaga sp.]